MNLLLRRFILIFILSLGVFSVPGKLQTCFAEETHGDVYLVPLTNADTEYKFQLPSWTKAITVKCRTSAEIRMAFRPGIVASGASIYEGERIISYLTISPGSWYEENPIETRDILYFASSTAGVNVEIIVSKV